MSLLDQHSELKRLAEARALSAAERQAREEEHILESVAQSKALMGVAELAKGESSNTNLSVYSMSNRMHNTGPCRHFVTC